MVSSEAKHAWASEIADAVEPSLRKMTFERTDAFEFKRQHANHEDRYLFDLRFPRSASDPNEMYINPCIHVFYPTIEKVVAEFRGVKLRKGMPTMGGSLGLFSDFGHSKEWPIESRDDAKKLADAFLVEIKTTAKKFWDTLSSPERMLAAVETPNNCYDPGRPWKFHYLILVAFVRGVGKAVEHATTNSAHYRDLELSKLRSVLEDLVRQHSLKQ